MLEDSILLKAVQVKAVKYITYHQLHKLPFSGLLLGNNPDLEQDKKDIYDVLHQPSHWWSPTHFSPWLFSSE